MVGLIFYCLWVGFSFENESEKSRIIVMRIRSIFTIHRLFCAVGGSKERATIDRILWTVVSLLYNRSIAQTKTLRSLWIVYKMNYVISRPNVNVMNTTGAVNSNTFT